MGVDPETVTYDGDGNIHVPADGLYTITLDYTTGTMTLTEGMIYGMGPAFNDDWTKEKFPGVVNADGTATITALSAGALRVYAPCAFDWWQHEFQPTADGKIAYREGAELEGFAVEAGQVITFDFNAGTATVAAAWSWDDINETAGPESNTRIKGWKYYANASTIYILFRIDKTKIKSDSTLDWDPYIYIGLDTDNNATTGAAGGGGTMDGCEAQVCVFPWRGTTAAPECVNGEDANGWIKCPISGNSLATPTVYGKIEGDWCYEEVRIPRDLIGATAAGTIAFDASMSWYPLGRNEITLN